jgi:hypothetical protein
MQTHYCPVACCGMRMQAASFTVESNIYVHAILTLTCLCRALRLTRPCHRLPRPSRSLPSLTRLFSYLTSPDRPLPRHRGREGLRPNQPSVGLPSHWNLYPLLLRKPEVFKHMVSVPSVPCLTRCSGDCQSLKHLAYTTWTAPHDDPQNTQEKIKYVTLPLQIFIFSGINFA